MTSVTVCSDFWAQENKICHCFHCFSIYLHKVMGPDVMILGFFFWMLSFNPAFPLSSFNFLKRISSYASLSAIMVVSSAYLEVTDISPCNLFFKFIYFNWRLITLQYFSGFTIHGHESTTDVHVCVPHPEPPSPLPPHPIPLGHPVHQPRAPCLRIRIWTGSLFHIW